MPAQFPYLIGRRTESLGKNKDNEGVYERKDHIIPHSIKQNGKDFNSLSFTAFQTWTHSLLLLKEQKGAELKKEFNKSEKPSLHCLNTILDPKFLQALELKGKKKICTCLKQKQIYCTNIYYRENVKLQKKLWSWNEDTISKSEKWYEASKMHVVFIRTRNLSVICQN